MLEFLSKIFNSMSGLKVGDIDIGDQVIDHEYKIQLLLKFVNWLIDHTPPENRPTPDMIRQWQEEIIAELRTKYPNSGIELRR